MELFVPTKERCIPTRVLCAYHLWTINNVCHQGNCVYQERNLSAQPLCNFNNLRSPTGGAQFNSWPGHWTFQKCFTCFPANYRCTKSIFWRQRVG
ncbi:hypothetical protein DPMN_066188 [Dreissena polymorpha]|uniref:Uncharacterized protein n=1 Tax=Dreissena polymorpha TaxID=45954 RepID=A0A9D3YTJ7_DREPO|nr:hypothetical protein DPMN_066188 [Dreissena polymorpha]